MTKELILMIYTLLIGIILSIVSIYRFHKNGSTDWIAGMAGLFGGLCLIPFVFLIVGWIFMLPVEIVCMIFNI